MRGWLQQKALFEADWTPEYHELSFGLKSPAGRDPRSRKEAVTVSGGYQLQGSIDLVERHAGGMVRVVDHKTGRIPEPRPETVGRGEVLQPTLYALAAEAMLGEPVAVGRLYYSTIAQNYTADRCRDARLDAPPRAARARGDRRGDRQRHSSPPRRAKMAARTASISPICGPYEEERVKEKSQAELKGLKELRGWK